MEGPQARPIHCSHLCRATARERATKKAGEWQTLRIRCAGSKCRVWVNGRQVIKADLAKLAEKVKNVPGLKRTGGFIGLQNHSSPVFYRNIRIKELK